MEFRVIEHTADVGVEVKADSLSELFEGTALAMTSLMVDTSRVGKSVTKNVELEADDLDELMFMWLNEILYIVNTEEIIFCEFSVDVNGNRLEGSMRGEPLDFSKHEIKDEIKAATYHELTVKREGELWEVRVIFDV